MIKFNWLRIVAIIGVGVIATLTSVIVTIWANIIAGVLAFIIMAYVQYRAKHFYSLVTISLLHIGMIGIAIFAAFIVGHQQWPLFLTALYAFFVIAIHKLPESVW